jgi:hypothetical protein
VTTWARFRRPGVRMLVTAGLVTALLPAAPTPARAEGLSIGRVTLTGTHTRRHDEFGVSVAVSGTTAVVGAYYHGGGTGAAYVFTERGGLWHQQAVLTPGGRGSLFFGWSVAISGGTIAVGSPVVGEPGQVYVFTRTGTTWSRTATFQASDGVSGDQFGAALALSGTTLVVGAPGGDWTNNKAYVFGEQDGHWAQRAELTASNGLEYDNFGRAVALSGKTIVVGAPGRLGQVGAAYVYTGSGGTWAQQAELTASDGLSGDQFGAAVAVSGTTALIGAPHRNTFNGSVYVFTQANGTWAQRAELRGPDTNPFVYFGSAVAMERRTAVIVTGTGPLGTAYLFKGDGASWTRVHRLAAPVGRSGFFGSAALSGNTAIIGVPSLNHFTGAAYLYGPV